MRKLRTGGEHRTDRVAVLRRLDVAARAALLAAGLLAQWAMWIVTPAWVYVVAAVALVALSVEAAGRPFGVGRGSGSGRRRRIAYRIVACVTLAEVCVVVVGSVSSASAVSIAVPIGVLLLTVQGAHVQTIESRRDAVVGLFVVTAMLLDAGLFAHNARPAAAILPAAAMVLVAAALLQRGSVLAGTRAVIGLPKAAVLRTLVVPATTAIVIGALAFVAMPNSLQLGTRTTSGQVALTAAGRTVTAGEASLDPSAARLDLRARAALSNQPVFAVAADSPAYWQGTVFDTFDGSSWTSTGAAAQPATAGEPIRTDTVQVLSPQGLDAVMAPGAPTAYSGPGEMVTGADDSAVLAGVGATAPWTYEVSSASPAATPVMLRTATGSDPTDPKWTAVEPGLPSRVRGLAAQLTAPAATRLDAVSAVDDYLQTHETYDLMSPVPAPGHDAVDDFLFVSHRGFCEQFASAAVVMLRSIGIPTRLVTGYSHGDLTSESGKRVMRGTDAHAWIQVWYPGVGWVNSDPTAAAVLPAPAFAKAPTKVAAPDRHPSPIAAVRRIMPGGRTGTLLALAALLAMTSCAAMLIGVVRRRRPGTPVPLRSPESRPGDGPVLQAYVRLDAALGGPAREPEQARRDVARYLDAGTCSAAEFEMALECLERECYAIEPPTPTEVAVAVDVFDRVRALFSGALVS